MKKPKILCVDDEIDVLEGIEQNLRRHYKVRTATSGQAGLDLLAGEGHFAVVMSDMRMPEMNGAEFLAKASEVAPNSVRMLLTGQTDMDSAIAAVNEGKIFRFLTKPCSPKRLQAAFESAYKQHRLISAERELLEETLRGSISALTDVLALTSPTAFGRANRIKSYVNEMAESLNTPDRWQVEVAAMLSQLGMVTLPPCVVQKVYCGDELSEDEEKMVAGVPAVTRQLVERIPRLEPVLTILEEQEREFDSKNGTPAVGARMIKIAGDYDAFESRGYDSQRALDTMRSSRGRYDPRLLDLFSTQRGSGSQQEIVKEIDVRSLRPGMILVEDVHTETGMVFVSRGYEVTERFVERAHNFPLGVIKGPLRVVVGSSCESPSSDE